MNTALITGAAGGIGRELARQLVARGTTVIAVCRKPSAELAQLPVRSHGSACSSKSMRWRHCA